MPGVIALAATRESVPPDKDFYISGTARERTLVRPLFELVGLGRLGGPRLERLAMPPCL